ncbi:hypothetical protein CASFOL_003681 [Castilleja foliolosa]|uniref:Sister chromatid cohesion 1 protein 4 n=1 Tax=Castilleja foliolosa TaxID=1961234 RepID=A0ABD3EHV9_9LAMI
MFYSQFILAKKGPLGTIWIAAHLERKLRKNQVADTDIGVSVDSILSPDVPIALRMTSHLLLGVVRIYNRKVNYLFDDCSEALLKVKQAFRSAAVDLPPEESKAPYHSITLPENFDLDDFELPDSDIFKGNYVDHHISSREQITLQDSVEGVSYSTSKFGLDERFGDGDASGLDLEEELFLNKIGTAGVADESADPQASYRSMSPDKRDEHTEDRPINSETMADGDDEHADLMDYAQAPRTPGLVEESNLSNVKDALACDDHLESEYPLMESAIAESENNVPCENRQLEVDLCSRDDIISDAVPQDKQREENDNLSSGLEIKEPNPQEVSPIKGQDEAITPTLELTDRIEASDVRLREDLATEAVKEDGTHFVSNDETIDNHQSPNEVDLGKSAVETSCLTSTVQQVSEDVSEKDQQKSCDDSVELAFDTHIGQETENSLNFVVHDKEVASVTLVSGPCDSIVENPDLTKPGDTISTGDANVQSDIAALGTNGIDETTDPGKEHCIASNSEQNLKENRVQEHVLGEDIQVSIDETDAQAHNKNSTGILVEQLNSSTEPELHVIEKSNSPDKFVENPINPVELGLPAPEKLLSVPEGHIDSHRDMLVEVNPSELMEDFDAWSKSAAGKKRSFTESTLTEQSLNSVESSRQVRAKRTSGSIPDDDDLLSSILVGRSSVLKVKPTPPLSEVMSMKRSRTVPRSSAPKRKVLIDDTMVLHGDTIRHQLTDTGDIRRVRKKAPCTLVEISMIQKQHMEDDIFLGTIFTGMSAELTSLHGQTHDLGRITICKDDVNVASLETVAEQILPIQDDKNDASETIIEPNLAPMEYNHAASLETVAISHLASPKNENQDKVAPDENNVIDINEQVVNNELLTVTDYDITEPNEIPFPIENQPEEVNYTSTDFNFSQEQTNPANNDVGPDDAQVIPEVEPLEESAGNTGMVSTDPLNEFSEGNYQVDVDAPVDAVPDQTMPIRLAEMGNDEIDNGLTIEKDGENEIGAKDDIVIVQDEAFEVIPDATNYAKMENNFETEIYNATMEEQREVGFSDEALVSGMEDSFVNNGENLNFSEAYQPSMADGEFSGFDMRDRDETDYSAAGNDTEFLNVDDDDLNEMDDDDHMPDDEGIRNTDNSGWSTRTRAVSKYLQGAFAKEAKECGNKSLSMNNLLTGKSRKEASRMFFETLVLKTRDYIDVEQKNPYDDITIKSRTRLMKSDF